MKKEYDELLDLALIEDLQKSGDITSSAIFKDEKAEAFLLSKEQGILSGSDIFCDVFKKIDSNVSVRFMFKDGDTIEPNKKIAFLEGKVVSILKGERISLNLISFLSGIATQTNRFVKAVKASGNAIILDTRKTLPGYRALSKYAVKTGGGENHRMGLFDMVLIKDNHIDACGTIRKAVSKVREMWDTQYKIEVECRTSDEVREALSCGIDMIMLDNMQPDTVAECVSMCAGKVKIEASGQMDLEKAATMSRLGVDYISVGALTKSVRAFDFSLDIKKV
jgi:nicotinate-nucleotide pyrophosphorylase (carboxylating)